MGPAAREQSPKKRGPKGKFNGRLFQRVARRIQAGGRGAEMNAGCVKRDAWSVTREDGARAAGKGAMSMSDEVGREGDGRGRTAGSGTPPLEFGVPSRPLRDGPGGAIDPPVPGDRLERPGKLVMSGVSEDAPSRPAPSAYASG